MPSLQRGMKCAAPVEYANMIRHRASRSTDPQCQRFGKVKIHGRWYCRQHAPHWRALWATHDAIVRRIRSL